MKNLDWSNLGFGYQPTDYNVRCYFRNGAWGKLEVSSDEYLPIHMAASCLHYGQEAFEGMKAFRGQDGKVRLFRPEENAKRMIRSAEYVKMAAPTVDMFVEACKLVVKLNEDYVPPFGTGASLYLRPLLIGTGAQIGIAPSNEYLFIIMVMPVGPYFKEGFRPISVLIDRDYDRAAPLGTGHVKVGGNYAASLFSSVLTHDMGYSTPLYLDAKEKKYIDECGAANFFGIKNNTYITPASHSILPSITNMSIRTLAEEMGLKVEARKIDVTELSTFDEAGACGTAAVISPIGTIYDKDSDTTITYGNGKPGPWSVKLYERLRAIQYGQTEDTFNWNVEVL